MTAHGFLLWANNDPTSYEAYHQSAREALARSRRIFASTDDDRNGRDARRYADDPETLARWELGTELRDHAEENVPELSFPEGIYPPCLEGAYQEMLSDAVQGVDWNEVAASLIGDVIEEEEWQEANK